MVTCQKCGVNGVGLNEEQKTQRTLPRWISQSLVKSMAAAKPAKESPLPPVVHRFTRQPPLAAALMPAKRNMNKVFYTYAAAWYVCPSSGNKMPNK
jgi:hypothetical protein